MLRRGKQLREPVSGHLRCWHPLGVDVLGTWEGLSSVESSAEPVLLNVDMAKPGDDVIVLVIDNAYCLRVVVEGRG